jgi:hypothetical protein
MRESTSLFDHVRRWLGRKPMAERKREEELRAYAAEHARAITGKPAGDPCGCGWPDKPCLRVMLRNGPPFPEPPCEPEVRR